MLGGMMVSYTRARAEGLGVPCEIGLLQRPERFVLLGFGSIFSSVSVHVFGSGARLARPVGLAAGGAVQRHGAAAHRPRHPRPETGRTAVAELHGKGWRVLGYFLWMLGAGVVLDSDARRAAACPAERRRRRSFWPEYGSR